MKIIGYLMIIAALEGALHEYMRLTATHVDSDVYHGGHHSVSSGAEKEPTHTWYEIIMIIMQSVWALLAGTVKLIWGGIHKWIELMLVIFECNELVHKLAERFNLWGGLH